MNKFGWLACGTVLILSACGESEPTPTINPVDTEATVIDATELDTVAPLDFANAASAFQRAAQKQTQVTLARCATLQKEINAFLLSPSDTSQSEAQESFVHCYQSWIRSALYFQLPFNLSDNQSYHKLMDLIDTRPFLPGYIDGIPEYPFSGIVYEHELPLTASNLRSQHRLMDEDSASVGFPVIEFFLWKVPAEQHWVSQGNSEAREPIDRRRQYLELATTLLIEHLTQAVTRWQDGGRFSALPERAQLTYVFKSLQRLTMVELLANQFEEVAINEPDWYHSAIISGQGLTYPLAKLEAITHLLMEEETADFSQWLNRQDDLPVTLEALSEAQTAAYAAVQKLPTNYPLDSEADENWQQARQKLAQVALYFSQISEHYDVSILTE